MGVSLQQLGAEVGDIVQSTSGIEYRVLELGETNVVEGLDPLGRRGPLRGAFRHSFTRIVKKADPEENLKGVARFFREKETTIIKGTEQ
jgi:hypothetical protein